MAGDVVEMFPGAAAVEPHSAIFLCGRGSGATRCLECLRQNRNRNAVALCDGPPAPASLRSTCSSGMCGEHRTRVGPTDDLCVPCAKRAVAAKAIERVHDERDEPIFKSDPDEAPTLFDVATAPGVRRIG